VPAGPIIVPMTSPAPVGTLGRFLTIADTADLLNISVTSTYALVRSGELPAIRIGTGGQWRVESTAIDAFIATRYEEERRIRLWERGAEAQIDEPSWG